MIYEDALAAYSDPHHPAGVSDGSWQLPEPFNGMSANSGIVFLGLNPSYDPNEGVPRIRATFEEWDSYFRRRFERPQADWHKLYRRYQKVGELATSSAFRLGRDALVLEVVRFRSARGEGCTDPAVLDHELPITRRLMDEVKPKVIVGNGSSALWGLQELFTDIKSKIPTGTPLRSVELGQYRCNVDWGSVTVIPTRHLSAAFGVAASQMARLAKSITGALDGGSG